MPLSATAGTFDASYSGASHSGTTTYNGVPAWSEGGSEYGAGGHVNCSGAITATLTWDNQGNPADLAPTQAVVEEQCYVNWGGTASPNNPGGACNNPLGGTSVPAQPGSGVGATWQAVKYSILPVQNGTVTVPACSATASATNPNSGYPQGAASVIYAASAAPLEVVLSGGIGPNMAKHYLIGQQCSASLSSGGLTPSNYNWTASGGDVFYFWTADQGQGELTPLGLVTFSTFQCYFKKPDTGTVTCTVDLAVPSGAYPVGGFPGTTVTQKCQIDPPGASFSADIGDVEFVYPDVSLTGLPDPGGYGQPVGITWPCYATTPSAYITSSDVGGWNYVQLITPNDRRVNQGIAQALTLNGILCLDNSYPYDSTSYNSNGATEFAADGRIQTRADRPSDFVFSGLSFLNDNDSFQTWLMYRPPGANSSYVPIRKIDWYWHASLSLTGSAWALTSSPSDCGWQFDGSLYPDFPEWDNCLSNAYLGTSSAYTPPVP